VLETGLSIKGSIFRGFGLSCFDLVEDIHFTRECVNENSHHAKVSLERREDYGVK
jgi:hypothetical protein